MVGFVKWRCMMDWFSGHKSFFKSEYLDEYLWQEGFSKLAIAELNPPEKRAEEKFIVWAKVGIAASVISSRFTTFSPSVGCLGIPKDGSALRGQLKRVRELIHQNRYSPLDEKEIEAEFERFTLYAAKRRGGLSPEKAGRPPRPEGLLDFVNEVEGLPTEAEEPTPPIPPILGRRDEEKEPSEPEVSPGKTKPVKAPQNEDSGDKEKSSLPIIKLPWYLRWSRGLIKKAILAAVTFLLGMLAGKLPFIAPFIDKIIDMLKPALDVLIGFAHIAGKGFV
jgi:hypothetical protein